MYVNQFDEGKDDVILPQRVFANVADNEWQAPNIQPVEVIASMYGTTQARTEDGHIVFLNDETDINPYGSAGQYQSHELGYIVHEVK